MGLKTTGLEFKRFYGDEDFWGDHYQDEVTLIVDGQTIENDIDADSYADSAVVEIENGYILSESGGEGDDIESFFKRWQKTQKSASFVVTVEKAKEAELRKAIEALGGVIG
jgi:hypothetical protein